MTTKYVYDGGQVIAEYDGSDNPLRKFVYGPGIDEPIIIIDIADNNAVYHYHFDGLCSVAALSNVNGEIVERYSYDVFGQPTIRDANNIVISGSSLGNSYMFTGRRRDNEIGNYYYRARYYNPDIGRFLQTDPIGYAYSMNLYEYCWNNPLNWVDPYGLVQLLIGGSGTAGAAGGGTGGVQLVIGSDFGFYFHGGGGGHAGMDYGTTIDFSILSGRGHDLNGTSLSTGFSAKIPIIGIGFGGEANIGRAYGGTFSINIPVLSGGVTPGNIHGYVERGVFVPFKDAIPTLGEIGEYWRGVFSNSRKISVSEIEPYKNVGELKYFR